MRKLMFVMIAAALLPAAGCRSWFEGAVSIEERKNEWIRENVYGAKREAPCGNSCNVGYEGVPVEGPVFAPVPTPAAGCPCQR